MIDAPTPWGWLYYFWCKHIHRAGYDKALSDGNVYACQTCNKRHYFLTGPTP